MQVTRLFSRGSRLALSFIALCSPLLAQSSTGQIDVIVTDPSEAIVSAARVTLIGAETGAITRSLTTNESGVAPMPLLPPGTYNVKVEKEGFKTLLRKGIVLRITEVASLRLTLELGSTTQAVTITGDAPLVDTASNTQGQVVDDVTMQQLPLNGRNYLQLTVLTAGTVPSTNKDQSFSAFGNRGMQNVYLLDGGLNQSYIRGIDNRQRDAVRPSLEAIQEFKVQTSNYSAEYGSSAGGVVSVVTKSGTNEIHGSAFNFLRNSAVGARDFFAPPGPVPHLVFNQYGGALGGPIVKNRAWIFGAYQGTQIRQETIQLSTVPTPALKSGVFNLPTYDPNTTVAAGNTFARTLFPNNTIPSARFNSIGASLARRYPDPNAPGNANNYVRVSPTSTALHVATIRGDVQLTTTDRVFGRLTSDRSTVTGQPPLPPPAATPVAQRIPSWNIGFGYTRVFGPTLVNEFRFAWSQPEIAKDATAAKDEIVPGALAPGVESSTPTFNVTGFATLGAQPAGLGNVPLHKTSEVWEFSDNATKNLGSHLLKFGYTHQLLKFFTLSTLQGRGGFSFDGGYTQNPQSRPNTGSALADLLLGHAQTVTRSSVGTSDLRVQNDLLYIQDDWKITPRLTLNLGVRYELYWTITDTQDKLGNFILDPSDRDYGRLVYAGLNGRSRSLMAVDRNNIAPRIGFAYRVPHAGDLTVRGGYGMFYGNPDEQTGVGGMMTNNPPFVGAGGLNLIGDRVQPSTAFNLSGSLPPLPPPIRPQDYVVLPTATSTLFSWQRNYTAPVVHQWNLSLQKQFGQSTVFEVSYIGNSSYGLWGTHPGNQPLTPGPGGINTRRPLAAYTIAPVTVARPWARGYYEGAIARLERRLSKGLYFLASFTYGRAIDLNSGAPLDGCAYCTAQQGIQNAYSLSAQRGISDSNSPRRFVFSASWDLPFGRGQRYATSGWAAHVLGGWQTSGILTAQDGTPFTLNLSLDNANTGQPNWPNRTCNGRLDNPTAQRWFDQSCFVTPPAFTYGNTGRNPLYGPGVSNVDFAVHRFFPIPLRESLKLEFRAELYNLFNHPIFGMPGVTLGLPQTGQITATDIPNRQAQFGLKLIW